jgi:hypothetical protein
MKAYDNGCYYTVAYSARDSEAFSDNWPCSTVKGSGSFQFDKRNGDLVDATGSAALNDGSDWLAFCEDCKKYGKAKLKLPA